MKPIHFTEHPEGGRFCEVYRSISEIYRGSGEKRCALTHIYFSLSIDEISHFHKVDADEVWNLYQGKGLYLYMWDGVTPSPTKVELSAQNNAFCHVVPAGVWQAVVPIQDTVLVGCSVAPGFEYAGFELMQPRSEDARRFSTHNADLLKLIIADSQTTFG